MNPGVTIRAWGVYSGGGIFPGKQPAGGLMVSSGQQRAEQPATGAEQRSAGAEQPYSGAPRPIFYGWYIVATCIFVAFVTNGARNSFGIFVLPMSEEFGWSRGEISFAAALGLMVNGLTQPFMGQLLDRFGGRRVIVSSLVVFGLVTMVLSLTFHLLFLIFMFGFVSAVALSGMSLNNTGALLARWFRQRRATVVGLNAAGLSAGMLILIPFGMYLLQATNWRVPWVVFGLMVLLLAAPLAFLFLRNNPADLGLRPYGEAAPATGEGGSARRERRAGVLDTDNWRQSFRSMPIWQMTIAYFACGYTTAVLSVHFVPFAHSLGVEEQSAALIFGLMMGLNIVGSIGAGILSDRFSRKNMLGLVYFVRGTAYMALLAGVELMGWGTPALLVFAVVAGISWIATAPLTTALIADVYGLRALGQISGVAFLVHAAGSGLSTWLAGLLFDWTGSYTIPFLIAGLLLFPASLFAFAIKERRYSARYQPAVEEPAAAVAAAGD